MEKSPPAPKGLEDQDAISGFRFQKVVGAAKVRKAHAISQRALANLLKGARAGGFVPYEIVLGASGEVRLMAAPGPAERGGKPNDFDAEFG